MFSAEALVHSSTATATEYKKQTNKQINNNIPKFPWISDVGYEHFINLEAVSKGGFRRLTLLLAIIFYDLGQV